VVENTKGENYECLSSHIQASIHLKLSFSVTWGIKSIAIIKNSYINKISILLQATY